MTFSAAKMTVQLILDGRSVSDAVWKAIREAKLENERQKVNGSSIILDQDQTDLLL